MPLTLLCGGKVIAGPGNYFKPTILAVVTHEMNVMNEESFGPVIGIMKVRDAAQAIALMNDTRYGLTASVFCTDEKGWLICIANSKLARYAGTVVTGGVPVSTGAAKNTVVLGYLITCRVMRIYRA